MNCICVENGRALVNEIGSSGAGGITGGLATSDILESSVWSGDGASSLDLLSSNVN